MMRALINRHILKLLLCLCLCAGGVGFVFPVAAEEADGGLEKYAYTPQELLGVWANPSCETPHDLTVYTKRFVFRSTQSDNALYRQTAILKSGQIYRMGIVGPTDPDQARDLRDRLQGIYDVKLSSPDEFLYFQPMIFVNVDAGDPFAIKDNPQVKSYKKCTARADQKLYLSAEGLKALDALDRVDMVCGTASLAQSLSCKQAVFEAFDNNKDAALTEDELIGAYRQIVFLSASQGCGIRTYYPADLDKDARLYAKSLLSLADFNKNGVLSLKEIEGAFPAFAALKKNKESVTVMTNLAVLLPFIPKGDFLEGCTCLQEQSGTAAEPDKAQL